MVDDAWGRVVLLRLADEDVDLLLVQERRDLLTRWLDLEDTDELSVPEEWELAREWAMILESFTMDTPSGAARNAGKSSASHPSTSLVKGSSHSSSLLSLSLDDSLSLDSGGNMLLIFLWRSMVKSE